MLPFAITLQLVQPIAGRHPEVVTASGQVDVFQLACRSLGDIGRKPLRRTLDLQVPGVPIGERLDHRSNVMCHVTRVKDRSALFARNDRAVCVRPLRQLSLSA